MAPSPVPNGNAKREDSPAVEMNTLPPVLGINFGGSYASIAVYTKEGLAESIANEDGERQIACAVAFHGEEIHIGSGALEQLVKNSKNTILGFRNLLGKKFSEIDQSTLSSSSATVIQHPDIPDEPAYKVDILQPAPSPIPTSNRPSNVNTPLASNIGTPRSEPIPAERILTVSEVTVMFLKSLLESAEDFMGKKVETAVITVPEWFTDNQRAALEACAAEAGIPVKQLLDEAAAAVATTTSDAWGALLPDRTQLIVDVGASAASLSLVSVREGLSYVIASSHTPTVRADQIDDKLIKFFAADFTKKTKTPLTVAPATELQDRRAEARLRLAIEHTKRTISASPGAATCSVESLKDGLDYTGSINRMRFDMVVSPVYGAIADAVVSLLSDAGVDAHEVDEIVYVGGTAALPGLDERIILTGGFDEDVETPFSRGTVTGGGVGDPTTILARGAATQAALIASVADQELVEAFHRTTKANQVKATTRTIGLLFPSTLPEHADLGGVFVPVVQKETALPVRRVVQLDVGLTEESKRVAFEVWEIKEGIRVEKIKLEPVEDEDEDEEDEEPEETEVKHKIISKEVLLGAAEIDAALGIQAKGKSAEAGSWSTVIQAQFIVGIEGQLDVEVKELGDGGAVARLHVPAP